MAKKKFDPVKEATISSEMIKNCKDEIAKFGFEGKDYINFLVSVSAMTNKNTVVEFPVSDMAEYRDKFIKKHEHSIGDTFALDKFKIKTSGDFGKPYDTGWFCPRSFWDYILSVKI